MAAFIIGDRVMRVMLARELEQSIASDLYFAARDLLLKRRLVGRLRGQGGQSADRYAAR